MEITGEIQFIEQGKSVSLGFHCVVDSNAGKCIYTNVHNYLSSLVDGIELIINNMNSTND